MPAGGQVRLWPVARLFQVNVRAIGQQLLLRQSPAAIFEQIGGKRRIQEHEVEFLTVRAVQVFHRVQLQYDRPRGIQGLDIVIQCLDRPRRFFNEHRAFRTTRQSLQTQRAGAGKQVEAASAMNLWRQPVKQRLADPLGAWSQSRNVRNSQQTTAPVSRYNTQPSRLWFAPCVSFCHGLSAAGVVAVKVK